MPAVPTEGRIMMLLPPSPGSLIHWFKRHSDGSLPPITNLIIIATSFGRSQGFVSTVHGVSAKDIALARRMEIVTALPVSADSTITRSGLFSSSRATLNTRELSSGRDLTVIVTKSPTDGNTIAAR